MKRLRNREAAAGLLLLAAVVAAPAIAPAEIVERIVAKVNNDVITKTEWEDMVGVSVAARGEKVGPEERAKIAEHVLETMIADRLVVQAALRKGLKVNDNEVAPRVDAELDALKARFPSTKAFNAQLKKEGITYGDLRYRYLRQMKDRFLYMKMMNLKQRELEAAVEVGEGEIAEYYEKNKGKEDWKTRGEVVARHILFTVDTELKGEERKKALAEAQKRARAAAAALKRGEKFEDVAKSLSEDPVTRERGGDLGRVGRGTYDPALEKVLFSLSPGRESGPVESPAGVHILKVEKVFAPRTKGLEDTIVPPAAMAAPGAPAPGEMPLGKYIEAVIRNGKLSGRLQEWIDSLRSEALIERFVREPVGK